MEITLVRHAQPHWEPQGRATDTPDLTELGHEQARCTAEALRGERYDAIYTSPLPRARQTAAPIAASLGLAAQPCSWLRELELPKLAGLTPAEVQHFFRDGRLRELERWWDGYEGGETFRHFYERVSGGIESLLVAEHALAVHEQSGHRVWQVADPEARLLLVAHEGTNAVILSHLLGIEPTPWASLRFASAWTGISRIHTTSAGGGYVWSLECFNRTHHLDAIDLHDGRPPRQLPGGESGASPETDAS